MAKPPYIRIGGLLREPLIEAVDAIGWEGDEEIARAAKIRAALAASAPYRGGYLLDVHGWTWEDRDFLKDLLVDGVEQDMQNIGASRGFSVGNTPIGRQIRALREKL